MYKCEYFKPQEFVDKTTYNWLGEKAYTLIDDRLLKLMDELRILLGCPIMINDWVWGGKEEWRGLRTSSSPYFNIASQHSFGRAVDFEVSVFDAVDVYDLIKNWHETNTNGIASIAPSLSVAVGFADHESWIHLDLRNNEDGFNIATF